MNKAELIEHVAMATGLAKKDAEEAVDAVLSGIMATIKQGEDVSMFGFGKFSPKANAARTGRNPQTGETIKIAASKSVRFAPALAFKTSLNAKPAKRAATKKAPAAKKSAPAKAAITSTVPASKATKSAAKRTTKK